MPRGVVALSNTRIESQNTSDDGYTTVRFAETRPLPSYLVAFAVGPWEFVDLGQVGARPTPTRIVVPRGRRADTEFVARAYPELFTRVESWFGIPYPFDKLDHITIPITVNFAMENAGLITYGAPNFLAKPGAATPRFRRIAANIGTHEVAHQWFGDLVTMVWWDDLWLNEAFATWIADKIVNQWRPDYDRGAARIDARADAIDADMLVSARQIREPIVTRGDIFNAFDQITYQKGATVIGMFEGWIGEESFRSGVRSYIEARRDGSATSEDFLGSLSQASRLPVAPAFNTFLNQNGVPQVEVRLQCGARGAQLALTQHRLELIGATKAAAQQWQIPVCARYGSGASTREACKLMTDTTATIPLAGGCPAFAFANAGGRGYYVPDYRDGLLAKLATNAMHCRSPSTRACFTTSRRSCARAPSARHRRCSGCASAQLPTIATSCSPPSISPSSPATRSSSTPIGRSSRVSSARCSGRARRRWASCRGPTRATTISCCAARCCASSRPRIRSSRRKRDGSRGRGCATGTPSIRVSSTSS